MAGYRFVEIEDKDRWNSFLNSLDWVHGFQLYEWGEIKKVQGWKPLRVALISDNKIIIGLQILYKSLIGFSFGYGPFGPVCNPQTISQDEWKIFFHMLNYYLKSKRILILIFQPYFNLDLHRYSALVKCSPLLLLYKRTYIVDLDFDLEAIFNTFNSKTRNQIRKSIRDNLINIEIDNSKKGVERFYTLYKETYFSKKLTPIRKEIFLEMLRQFQGTSHLNIFIARVSDKDISSAIIFSSGKTAVYEWAATSSNPEYRKLNTQRRLIWEMIKFYKENRYRFFDLGGIPSEDNITYKNYGVYEFKSFFGNKIYENSGTFILSPFPKLLLSNAFSLYELLKILRGYR